MPNPIYNLQSISFTYPRAKKPANQDISLQIYPGEIFGLLGDNGAGKTTLVRQMVNLLKTTSGQIELAGKPVDADPLHVARHVGYMPQESLSLNNLTVSEALYYSARLRGESHAASHRECERLISEWGMQEWRNQTSRRLSGGQRRMLRLAAAMAGSPPVLILDEPTNDLDPQHRKLVWDLLRQDNVQRGTTIIFITHDAIEAEKIIQRVAILRGGRLAALGSPAELKHKVDQKLRLELIFSPENPPQLPANLTHQPIQPGRWLVYLDRRDAATVLERIDLSQCDDFRLYSATLEDLYLYYANQNH
jgi:ABC-type multidrug transport system ATPase subunit